MSCHTLPLTLQYPRTLLISPPVSYPFASTPAPAVNNARNREIQRKPHNALQCSQHNTRRSRDHLAEVGCSWSEFYPAFDFFEYSPISSLEQSNAALQAGVEINIACDNSDDDVKIYRCIHTRKKQNKMNKKMTSHCAFSDGFDLVLNA